MIYSRGPQEDETNDGGEINMLPFQNQVELCYVEGETTPMCSRKQDICKNPEKKLDYGFVIALSELYGPFDGFSK